MKGEGGRLHFIDGLRGFSAFQVFNQHYRLHKLTWTWLSIVLQGRNTAATLFFVLSGRTIAQHILANPSVLASSAFRRPIRLFWPVFGALLIHNLALWMGGYKSVEYVLDMKSPANPMFELSNGWTDKDCEPQNVFGVAFDALNTFLTGKLVHVGVHNFPVLWTMPIEFNNSFLVYFVAAAFSQTKSRYIMYALACYMFFCIGHYGYCFLLGLVIAQLSHDGVFQSWNANWYRFIYHIPFCILPLMELIPQYGMLQKQWLNVALSWEFTESGIGFDPTNMIEYLHPSPLRALLAVSIIILAEINPVVRWIFSHRIMTLMGKYSFGLYLLHPSIIFFFFTLVWFVSVSPLIIQMVLWCNIPSTIISQWLIYTLNLISLFPALVAFYRIFDHPSVIIGKKLYGWLESISGQKEIETLPLVIHKS